MLIFTTHLLSHLWTTLKKAYFNGGCIIVSQELSLFFIFCSLVANVFNLALWFAMGKIWALACEKQKEERCIKALNAHHLPSLILFAYFFLHLFWSFTFCFSYTNKIIATRRWLWFLGFGQPTYQHLLTFTLFRIYFGRVE